VHKIKDIGYDKYIILCFNLVFNEVVEYDKINLSYLVSLVKKIIVNLSWVTNSIE
jgi:hypothetical protein